jgi:hypothetical protein
MRAGLMPQDNVKRQDISKLPPATTIAWMQRTGYFSKEEAKGRFQPKQFSENSFFFL